MVGRWGIETSFAPPQHYFDSRGVVSTGGCDLASGHQELHVGLERVFAAAGFAEVRRPTPRRA